MQIYALDSSGYVVRNYNATITLGQSSLGMADPNATIPATVVFHNGQASFKVTLVKAGAQTITVDSKAGLSTMISMIVAPPAAASSYSVNLRSRVQSGVPVTLQVVALDATGHRVPGYAAETNLRSPSQGVAAVSGSWTVPAVSGTGTAYSAVWVGIDGYGHDQRRVGGDRQ